MKQIHITDFDTNVQFREQLEALMDDRAVFHTAFEFDSCFWNAKVLRDIVDTVCTMMGLDSKWKTRIVLIVDELNNNAIEYGSAENDQNILEVYIAKIPTGFELKISVQDAGTGKNSKTAKEMSDLRDTKLKQWFAWHNSIRGRGLFMIISNLVDELNFYDNDPLGLTVEVRKKLPIVQ